MLTLADGKNINFLAEQCHFQAWIVVYYKEDMLKDSLVPGYPQESGHKALGIWCALLSGTGESRRRVLWLTTRPFRRADTRRGGREDLHHAALRVCLCQSEC